VNYRTNYFSVEQQFYFLKLTNLDKHYAVDICVEFLFARLPHEIFYYINLKKDSKTLNHIHTTIHDSI